MKKEFKFPATNKINLIGSIYEPLTSPKGIILICHGMAEHISRYNEFMEFLSNNGYIAVGYDQRGHGETAGSPDKCGYWDKNDNLEVLINDLHKVVIHLKKAFENLPIFLIGHSMGSFVSQRYIELFNDGLTGVILSGSSYNKKAFIFVGNKVASIITKIKGRDYKSKLLDNLAFGSYNKAFDNTKTNVDWLSRSEENNINYSNDEYCGMIFSASYFKDFSNTLRLITKNLELIDNNLPIYITSGDKDPVGNFGKGTTLLFNKLKQKGIKDLTLKLYKDARHEILQEINKEEVMKDMLSWIEKHNILI